MEAAKIPSNRLDRSIVREIIDRYMGARIGRGKSFKAGREGGRRRGEGVMWMRRNLRKVKDGIKDWMLWRRNDMKMDWEDRLHR